MAAVWGDSRPKAYVCYLCGAQFGSVSLHIHLPQCEIKFLNRQEQLPACVRKPLPPRPPSLPESAEGLPRGPADVRRFNDEMFEAFNAATLTRCEGCGRTFNPEAFVKHVGVCKGGAVGGSEGSGGKGAGARPPGLGRVAGSGKGPAAPGQLAKGISSSSSGPGFASKPRALTCYLCGQGFGSASLLIHVPQCEELFLKREATKPRGDPQRPLPPRPERLSQPLPRDAAGIDEFNREMVSSYNTKALVACPHCSRTFLPESLARHAKHCTAERPMVRGSCFKAAPAGGAGAGAGGAEQEQELTPCGHCGRKFSPGAHAVHERVCAKVFGGGKGGKGKERQQRG